MELPVVLQGPVVVLGKHTLRCEKQDLYSGVGFCVIGEGRCSTTNMFTLRATFSLLWRTSSVPQKGFFHHEENVLQYRECF